MSSILTKLARKFTIIINKQADVMKDPLLKLSPEKQYIQPEMTEDMDELVKDSLNLVILLERSFLDFQREALEDGNEFGRKLADNALIDLEDIQDALTNSELLNFDLDTETSYIDVVDQNVGMLKSVLDMINEGGRIPHEFKKLDQRVFKWVNELIENNDKLHDKAMSQSEFYDNTFQDRPNRMLDQDERDPDEIDPEEIHPDYDNPEFTSEVARDNDVDADLNPEYIFNDDTDEYERMIPQDKLRRNDGKPDFFAHEYVMPEESDEDEE